MPMRQVAHPSKPQAEKLREQDVGSSACREVSTAPWLSWREAVSSVKLATVTGSPVLYIRLSPGALDDVDVLSPNRGLRISEAKCFRAVGQMPETRSFQNNSPKASMLLVPVLVFQSQKRTKETQGPTRFLAVRSWTPALVAMLMTYSSFFCVSSSAATGDIRELCVFQQGSRVLMKSRSVPGCRCDFTCSGCQGVPSSSVCLSLRAEAGDKNIPISL